jgi:hypothetical protein
VLHCLLSHKTNEAVMQVFIENNVLVYVGKFASCPLTSPQKVQGHSPSKWMKCTVKSVHTSQLYISIGAAIEKHRMLC